MAVSTQMHRKPPSAGRPQITRAARRGTALQDSQYTRLKATATAISGGTLVVGTKTVSGPFGYIPKHIVHTQFVGLIRTHRSGGCVAVVALEQAVLRALCYVPAECCVGAVQMLASLSPQINGYWGESIKRTSNALAAGTKKPGTRPGFRFFGSGGALVELHAGRD